MSPLHIAGCLAFGVAAGAVITVAGGYLLLAFASDDVLAHVITGS